MPAINPVPPGSAAPDLKGLYEGMTRKFGFMPNFFAVMAQRPAVLQSFVGFYGAAINQGTVEPKYKELAYLKTSATNGCQY